VLFRCFFFPITAGFFLVLVIAAYISDLRMVSTDGGIVPDYVDSLFMLFVFGIIAIVAGVEVSCSKYSTDLKG